MRSNLFTSTLAIALGVVSPIVGAIGSLIFSQPLISMAGMREYSSIRKTSAYTIDEKARNLVERANILDIEGQYEKAIEYAFSSYLLSRKSGDLIAESRALFILGQVHFYHLKKYEKSLDYLKKSLKIIEKTDDIFFQIHTLCSIGNALSELGKAEEAISTFQLALQIYESKKNFSQSNNENIAFMSLNINLLESYILYGLGGVYLKTKRIDESLNVVHDALLSSRKFNNHWVEREALSTIGDILRLRKENEIAIIFYKQSVQATERMRAKLFNRSAEGQKAYLKTVSSTYRNLADLLLSQGRVLEAQQVLELLKTQELREYTKDTRSTLSTNGSPLNPLEAPIPAAFNDKIALGNRLTECDRQRCTDRSKLNSQVTEANKNFIALVTKFKDGLRSQEIKDPAQLQTDKLTIAAQKVILANPNVKTVLVYPLVLEDKLWLVWGSQAGKSGVIFDSKEVPVTRKDLSEKVRQLQSHLSNPNSNPKELQQVSQQLYQWLIQPIRQQLDDNKVQQIVFSLDRATRYIPMSTLHDSKQYLIENFALSTILTADIDTTDKLAPNPQDSPILGLGLTNAIAGLNALPAVETEINAIVRTDSTSKDGIYPGLKLFNQDFTEQSLRDNISGRRILHIATHGSFVPGNPEDSFLVLGNGQKLSIPAIRSITDLANTHLVVLSACETGKGGVDKEGIEVAGLGHYFLLSGAKSVLASLWLVNDPATSLLMNRFYQTLSKGNLSKAEALRQVQIAFINSQLTDTDAKALDRKASGFPNRGVRLHRPGQLPPGSFAHPYYWAPFILIGNSL